MKVPTMFIKSAEKVFERMADRSIVTWNFLLSFRPEIPKCLAQSEKPVSVEWSEDLQGRKAIRLSGEFDNLNFKLNLDTTCKIYAEMIGNARTDERSTKKYYRFVRLMGRAASHITLECALQTHPNITIIGEEVVAKKQNLKNVTDCITDIICKLADLGNNYGVILISKDLIGFIPEVQNLIAVLNEILAHDVFVESGLWKKKLRHQSQLFFEILPQEIKEQLMLERDHHGNVQAAKSDLNHIGLRMENILVQQLGIARRGTLSMESTTITTEAACGFHKDLQMGATKAIVQYENKTDPKVEISIVILAPQPAEVPLVTAESQSDVDCENILRTLSSVGLVQPNPELRLKKQHYALWYLIDNIAKEELHMLTEGTLAELG
ncbi:pyrophosphate--fructose 6-phosphate 1-phosphotransferase subunit beta 1-like [Aristolochia californica]|uniref:pyrophosphate--fructose 6-phosphate 1-phosphotransferase subunit beta 1-like n=1 Tax=Aristolochia californica TaxID=171875 RepID=UPI0035DEF132